MDTTHPPPTSSTTTLDRLLDAELDLSPTFRGDFSNHLAMSLVALHRMGAPDARLEETYRAHLAGESEPRQDRPLLDERLEEVRRLGIDGAVQARVPALADAPVTALFHPMIRLGYAIDVGHHGQAAAALLYWESRRHDLPVTLGPPGERRPAEVAEVLADVAAGSWPSGFAIDEAARRPGVATALEGLVDRVTAHDVASFALAAHAASGGFVTLHMVTGARAARTVASVLDGATADRLLRHTLVAMVVALAAVGAPRPLDADELAARRSADLPDREQVARSAVGSDDPHVVKLAETALTEEAVTGDRLYRDLAARVVGLPIDA